MRRLILLRHAKSDWSAAGLADYERDLAQRGRESASKVGEYMARQALRPDLVLCSPAARARKTWELAAQAFADRPPTTYDERLYEVGANAILDVIKATGCDVHVVLVVAHNPGLRDLAELLIASGDVERTGQLLDKFPTAGLAVIDIPIDRWTTLHAKSGRLDRFVAPRQLRGGT
jgi:phosphohistidine phosphatase